MNWKDTIDKILSGRDRTQSGHFYKLIDGPRGSGRYGMDVHFGDVTDVDESTMSVRFPYADGNARDGVGDLLDVTGIVLDRHVKNPVVLFDHGKQVTLPVGLAEDPRTGRYTVEIDAISKQALVKAFFWQGGAHIAEKTQLASQNRDDHALFCEQLFHLVAQKFIRGGSIGYQVLRASPIMTDYERGIPQGLHLQKVLQLECSIVVMPCNKDSVMKMLSMPKICGKPPSPYLVKSLSAYAETRKVQLAYERKAVNRQVAEDALHVARRASARGEPVFDSMVHGYNAVFDSELASDKPHSDDVYDTADYVYTRSERELPEKGKSQEQPPTKVVRQLDSQRGEKLPEPRSPKVGDHVQWSYSSNRGDNPGGNLYGQIVDRDDITDRFIVEHHYYPNSRGYVHPHQITHYSENPFETSELGPNLDPNKGKSIKSLRRKYRNKAVSKRTIENATHVARRASARGEDQFGSAMEGFTHVVANSPSSSASPQQVGRAANRVYDRAMRELPEKGKSVRQPPTNRPRQEGEKLPEPRPIKVGDYVNVDFAPEVGDRELEEHGSRFGYISGRVRSITQRGQDQTRYYHLGRGNGNSPDIVVRDDHIVSYSENPPTQVDPHKGKSIKSLRRKYRKEIHINRLRHSDPRVEDAIREADTGYEPAQNRVRQAAQSEPLRYEVRRHGTEEWAHMPNLIHPDEGTVKFPSDASVSYDEARARARQDAEWYNRHKKPGAVNANIVDNSASIKSLRRKYRMKSDRVLDWQNYEGEAKKPASNLKEELVDVGTDEPVRMVSMQPEGGSNRPANESPTNLPMRLTQAGRQNTPGLPHRVPIHPHLPPKGNRYSQEDMLRQMYKNPSSRQDPAKTGLKALRRKYRVKAGPPVEARLRRDQELAYARWRHAQDHGADDETMSRLSQEVSDANRRRAESGHASYDVTHGTRAGPVGYDVEGYERQRAARLLPLSRDPERTTARVEAERMANKAQTSRDQYNYHLRNYQDALRQLDPYDGPEQDPKGYENERSQGRRWLHAPDPIASHSDYDPDYDGDPYAKSANPTQRKPDHHRSEQRGNTQRYAVSGEDKPGRGKIVTRHYAYSSGDEKPISTTVVDPGNPPRNKEIHINPAEENDPMLRDAHEDARHGDIEAQRSLRRYYQEQGRGVPSKIRLHGTYNFNYGETKLPPEGESTSLDGSDAPQSYPMQYAEGYAHRYNEMKAPEASDAVIVDNRPEYARGPKSLVKALRRKYRDLKSLRRWVKKPVPGSAVLRVDDKDLADIERSAEKCGLDVVRLRGGKSGLSKIKLTGGMKAIDELAQRFGR